MGIKDRDKQFDEILGRHMRSRVERVADTGICPSVEILAACHEDSLPLAERILWKEHFASCGQCQEILADLAASDGILAPCGINDKREANKVRQMADPVLEEGGASIGPSVSEQTKTRNSRVAFLLPRRNTYWRWIAPAGAIAAGLLMWVAVHKKETATVLAPASVEVAQTDERAGMDSVRRNSTAVEPNMKKELPIPKIKQAEKDKAATEHDFEAEGVSPTRHGAVARAKAAPMAAPATPQVNPAEQGSVHANSRLSAENKTRITAQESAASAERRADLAISKKRMPAAAARQANSQVRGESVQAETASQNLNLPVEDGKALGNAQTQTSILILAPGGQALWRVGPAGLIEYSTDNGKSWIVQDSAVRADLISGDAPSDRVCWVGGRAGTVLRTTDGGEHWRKILSPMIGDVRYVHAENASHAIISEGTDKKSFETKDGGFSWAAVALK